MSGHSYEKWQDLGFQVKKGETASYKHYGVPMFKKNQVIKKSCSNTNSKHGFCDKCGEELRGNKSKSLCYECWIKVPGNDKFTRI